MNRWIRFAVARLRALSKKLGDAWRVSAEVNYRYRFWMLG